MSRAIIRSEAWVAMTLMALLLGTQSAHAGISSVVVTLQGPDSGWPGDNLTFVASGSYQLDADTQREITEGSASVSTSYSWSYGPATLVAGGGPGDNYVTVAYDANQAPGEYVVSVQFTVTLRIGTDESSSSATASKTVRIKKKTLLSIGSDKSLICAGARPNAVHQTWISGQVTDSFGGPVSGASVRFTITVQDYVQTPAVLYFDGQSGQELNVLSDCNGIVKVLLTSPDKVGNVTVEASGQWEDATRCSCQVQIGLPTFSCSPEEAVVAVTRSRDLHEALSFAGDVPVPSHLLHFEVGGDISGTAPDAYTNQNGVGTTHFTAGSQVGGGTVTAIDYSCYDADGQHPELYPFVIWVVRFDHFYVSNAIQIDGDEWANSIMPDDYVTVRAVLEPDVQPGPEDDVISWSGGQASDDDPLTRLVSRASSGTHPVLATVGNTGGGGFIHIIKVHYIYVISGALDIDDDNAACVVEPEGTILLQAHITPNIVIGPQLAQFIMWNGGQGEAGHPEQRRVSKAWPHKELVGVRCGNSGDNVTVWAIQANLCIPGVSESEEDTAAASVWVNSDDDNGNSNDDRNDSPVSGENDLIGVGLSILPEGVPGGTVSVSKSSGLGLWTDSSKTSAASSSYSVAEMPNALFVEGRTVSSQPGDQDVGMTFTWGSLSTGDEVHVTVLPREGSSEAYLKLYSDDGLSQEISGVASQTVYPVLFVTIGPGERATTTSLTITIKDEYPNYFANTDVTEDVDINLSSASGWEVYSGGQWVGAQQGPASTDNKEGSTPLKYRYKMEWNTTDTPLGNNGPHSIRPSSPVTFEEWVVGTGWTDAYTCGPAAAGATTSNVVVGGVQVTKGTIDYFKWDPESDDAALRDPVIVFNITDPTPHQYEWTIYYRQTSGSRTWTNGEYWAVFGSVSHTGQVTVHLTGAEGGDPVTGQLLGTDDAHEWGTYTYDIYVTEKDGMTDIDHNYLKAPYAMWIPKDAPDGDQDENDGHSVWVFAPENGGPQLRVAWWLNHQNNADAESLDLVVIDPSLAECTSTSADCRHGMMHQGIDEDGDGKPDGIKVYEYSDGAMPGTWRVLWTASDASGRNAATRRGHDAQRMLVANGKGGPPTTCTMGFNWGYYVEKPYCTDCTEHHVGTMSHLKLNIFQQNGQWMGQLPAGMITYHCFSAQSNKKFVASSIGGYVVNGQWDQAIKALKSNTTLFTFNGHASVAGTQGALSFWKDGKWQQVRGSSDGTAPPTGVVYHDFRQSWGLFPPPITERCKGIWMALLLGCHIANNTEGSLAYELRLEGAEATGGFSGTTYAQPMAAFALYFWDLAMGQNSQYIPPRERQGQRTISTAAIKALQLIRDSATGESFSWREYIPSDGEWTLYYKPGYHQILKINP